MEWWVVYWKEAWEILWVEVQCSSHSTLKNYGKYRQKEKRKEKEHEWILYVFEKGIYPGKMELQTNNIIRMAERKKENWALAQSIYLFI